MKGGARRGELPFTLSQESTLLVLLRALYSLIVDYGVYLPDSGDPLVFTKDQVVILVERGQGDALVQDLPDLAEEGLFRPLDPGALEGQDKLNALILEAQGVYVSTVAKGLNPSEPEYPEWWGAPIPFAICTRIGMKLNPTAELMFGADLERLDVQALPEKDEFIVELEGKGRPCFLAFRRLEPNIFIIDDCTGDLVEAQDISWWAAVGRAWTTELEAQGRAWRRSNSPAETGQSWPCEWEGRFLGYLCVEDAAQAAPVLQEEPSLAEEPKPAKVKKRASRRSPSRTKKSEDKGKKEDEVLKALGPQTMALLAAGVREAELDSEPTPEERRRGRKRTEDE